MRKIRNFYKKFISQIISVNPRLIKSYLRYFYLLRQYRETSNEKNITLRPILGEDTRKTGIDHHYFYQAVWTGNKIAMTAPRRHVDIGSQALFVGMITVITNVTFVDIRPLDATLDKLSNIKGSILNLPFPDNSIESLSCLHVAEHIGLGRYGDDIDSHGTEKGCKELARVLAPRGKLYFSVPIGKERVEFNAHRVHNPTTILSYFKGLKLLEFSAINDEGSFIENADINSFDFAKYSCGLFIFTKQ